MTKKRKITYEKQRDESMELDLGSTSDSSASSTLTTQSKKRVSPFRDVEDEEEAPRKRATPLFDELGRPHGSVEKPKIPAGKQRPRTKNPLIDQIEEITREMARLKIGPNAKDPHSKHHK